MKSFTLTDYKSAIEVLDSFKERASEIIKGLGLKSATLLRFEENSVIYEYNDSCHCHPDFTEDSFPVEWIFDQDWKTKQEERKLQRIEALRLSKAERAKAFQEQQEQQERMQYERLRQKYERK